jgi:hypothetical protein
VLYVPSEGRRGIARRLGSWLKVHDPDLLTRTDENLAPIHAGVEVNREGETVDVWQNTAPDIPFERWEGHPSTPYLLLDNSEEGQKSVKVLGHAVQTLGEKYNRSPLVIVDVVGDFAYTSDENSREFGHAIGMLKPETLAHGDATVVVVHHEGWSGSAKGRPRGHSSIDGLLDARIALDAKTYTDPEDGRVNLTTVKVENPKQRNEDQARPIILELSKPIDGLQNPVITGRLNPVTEASALANWGKSAVRIAGEREDGLSPKEVAYVRAVRELTEKPTNLGVALPVEVKDYLEVGKSTENGQRKRLLDKGFLASDHTRGKTGVKLTDLGKAAAQT